MRIRAWKEAARMTLNIQSMPILGERLKVERMPGYHRKVTTPTSLMT